MAGRLRTPMGAMLAHPGNRVFPVMTSRIEPGKRPNAQYTRRTTTEADRIVGLLSGCLGVKAGDQRRSLEPDLAEPAASQVVERRLSRLRTPLYIDYDFTFKGDTPPVGAPTTYTRIKLQFHWMPRRKDLGSEAPPLEISKKSRNREALPSIFVKTYGDLAISSDRRHFSCQCGIPEASKKAPVEKASPPSTAAMLQEEESAVVKSPSKATQAPIVIHNPFPIPPRNRKENSDSNDSRHTSCSSSNRLKPVRSLPNITLQGCVSSKPVQLARLIIPNDLGSSEKGDSGASKTVSPIKQEGSARQMPTTSEPVSKSTQKVTQKEKHKWSWASKGKTIGKAIGRSIRDVFKDGWQAEGGVEGGEGGKALA
ncbi:hypothetical protein V8F06_013630 [Rhypophila decipiens]